MNDTTSGFNIRSTVVTDSKGKIITNNKNMKSIDGVQFIFNNGYIVTLVGSDEKGDNTNILFGTGHISIMKYNSEDLTQVPIPVTGLIMDKLNHKPTEKEKEKNCSMFMYVDVYRFFEIIEYVKQIGETKNGA